MSFKRTKAIVAARRASAEKRQEEYNKLSLEEKLAKLPPEPHAARQRTKLLRQLEESKIHRHPTPEEMGVPPTKGNKVHSKEIREKAASLAQKARAERLQKLIDAAVEGNEDVPKTPRELTDRAAKKSKKGNK